MAQFKPTALYQFTILVFMAAVGALTTMAADADPLLDFCAADPNIPCKTNVTAADFFYQGISTQGNPNNDPS
ncbi:hypothetical protein M758_11G069600 [Ceratodon purpureus]|uniref:Uncharacterized protein n=1 Tax=Ceratodon purpureus TaxID=3225 RepID=A0A8T0GBW4_CERPU|nr:hypothetical protein KC19_11G071400 [Ceratodon purpureus]KAG0600901.1 hypothetical protein M758_11G069600 [Ceratodon purpureus]